MRESEFPKDVGDVVATLADIYRNQGEHVQAELVESAVAGFEQVDYDNWNGGTYTHVLKLEVPVPIFAKAQPRLAIIEADIGKMLEVICRNTGNHNLSGVSIMPLSSKVARVSPITPPPDADVEHIWGNGFRLFLSHVSAHKVEVAQFKRELKQFGIAAFVAHEDIIPTLEWQNEIELALRSMDALAALLTPDFHQGKWTDQEIGYALGRRALVVPVRLGIDPYGFTGKVQGFKGALDEPASMAAEMNRVLLANRATRPRMRKAIVGAFSAVNSARSAVGLRRVILTIRDFTQVEKASLIETCRNNAFVRTVDGLAEAVAESIGMRLATTVPSDDDIPF